MNPTTGAIRAGWTGSPIELRQSFTIGTELSNHLFWPVLMLHHKIAEPHGAENQMPGFTKRQWIGVQHTPLSTPDRAARR